MTPSNSAAKLKVACAGTGYFSQFHYEAWTRVGAVELVGVYNRSRDKADEFRARYEIPYSGTSLADLLDKTQAEVLDIITPPATHLESVRIAAERGVHVICQKPFGEDLAQAEAMVDLADRHGIKLVIHENFRFMPWYRKIKTVLDSGALGRVLNAEFKLRPGDGQGPEAYLARQPYFQDMPRFLVHETAIHLVDTFRFLFGEPESVYADLRRCNPVIKGEDSGLIVFQFPEQLQVVFDGNRLLDHSASNTRRTMGELEICGTQAELRLDGEARLWLRNFGEQTAAPLEYEWRDQFFGGDCVYETIAHIVRHFCEDAPLENQGRDYLHNIHIENAIYDAAAQGRRITLENA